MLNFDGISVALATPCNPDGELDVAGLERLISRTCEAGVVGVCPAGTTGEGPRLTPAQRVELSRRCREIVPGNVGVIGGVVSASLSQTLDELEDLAEAGVDAALLTPPTRMPLGPEGCRLFFKHLADRTPLPIVLYHIPQLTNVPIPAEVVLELSEHASIVGLKDSGGDLQYHLRVADGLASNGQDSFALLTGTDTMLIASLQVGSTGAIAASANLVPELSVAVHRAARAGDFANATEIERRLRAIVFACRRGMGPSGWKAALEIAGICSGDPVPPGERLSESQFALLRLDLQRLKVVQ